MHGDLLLAVAAPAPPPVSPQHPQRRPPAEAGEDRGEGDRPDAALGRHDRLEPLVAPETGVAALAECPGIPPAAGAPQPLDVAAAMPLEPLPRVAPDAAPAVSPERPGPDLLLPRVAGMSRAAERPVRKPVA